MGIDLWLSIVLIVGPLVLGTYLSAVQGITGGTAMVVWAICLFICVCGGYRVVRRRKEEIEEDEAKRYYRRLQEKQILYSRDFPMPYVDGLGENPLFEHSFSMGQRYEEESRFSEATKEYEECLSHPKATDENKVAANILMGNCHYRLSKLKDAQNSYEEALSISKRVKDKGERLRGRAAALGNIGLIYKGLGKPDDALKHLKETLGIHRRIGYEQGVASDLGNIGVIYSDLGKPQDALKHLKEALGIFKGIGAKPQIEIVSKGIRKIEEEEGQQN